MCPDLHCVNGELDTILRKRVNQTLKLGSGHKKKSAIHIFVVFEQAYSMCNFRYSSTIPKDLQSTLLRVLEMNNLLAVVDLPNLDKAFALAQCVNQVTCGDR